MQKILHVVSVDFSLPIFVGEQFRYFKNKGYNLHVICSASARLAPYAQKMEFDYSVVEITRSFNFFKDLWAVYLICRYIHKNRIDIVVGHSPKGALLAMIAAFLMRVPKRIYFRHGLVYETFGGLKRKLLINLDRITAFCANQVVCVSPSVYDRSLIDRLNFASKQIILGKGTCNGIDALNKFNPSKIKLEAIDQLRLSLDIDPSSFVIGYCGRLVRDKGIVLLIEAFKMIRSEMNDSKIKLLIVGGFEERDALPTNIENEIKINPDISFTGFVFDNIENYYALMSVSVLPSYREGFPTTVLESSSMTLPVITTKATGCIDSIIDNETGIFIDNNASTLHKALKFYYYNTEERLLHGKNGRNFVLSQFTNQIIWKEIEKIYV